MSADRLRTEVPPVVTAVVGIIVAVVSGVFGISAHGLAAGAAAIPPTSGDVLMVGVASAGIGAVTAALARRRPPLLTAAGGLLAGQALVHLVLSSGHSHSHPGGQTETLGHHVTDPAAIRAAMDGGVVGGAAGSAEPITWATLLTPQMLGAHAAAVLLTLAVVAALSGTLAWVAARVRPMLAGVRLVVVVPLLSSYDAYVPRGRYLLTGGGTRAPPAFV
ncbi:hypothetical protein ACWGLC_14055 [Dietzia sp. NPDC055877]